MSYEPYIKHTGNARSRAAEPIPALPKILIAVPACFKLDYTRWESEQSPHYKRSTAWNGQPYGTDIHISGDNPRIDAVRETWFRDVTAFRSHVTAKFFYGVPNGAPVGVPFAERYPRKALPDEVFLDCPDDYAHLPDKTRAICAWAVRQGFEYMLKCDDDTLCYVDRLVAECLEYLPDYGGYCGTYCSGGCGYWLSARAMKHVIDYAPHHWAEDVCVGHSMEQAHIKPVSLGNFHRPGFEAHWFFPKGFDATRDMTGIVAAHAVQPEVMRDWYAHERGEK